MQQPLIIGIGEVLWDLLPSGKQLGGAPANFAYHAQVLGARSLLISAIGDDDLGREVLHTLALKKLDTRFLQVGPKRQTGTVSIEVDPAGLPKYIIHEDVAWDYISWDEELTELAATADAVCFGSLAQRSFISRSTIQAFLQHMRPASLRVFDLNLRQAYYTADIVTRSLELATVLKLNDEEWPTLAKMLGLPAEIPEGPRELMARFELDLIALTRGASGSMLVTATELHEQPAPTIEVKDTVGAGDAFTAAITVGVLRGLPLAAVHATASRLAGYVCQRNGAMPQIPGEFRYP